jgi:hypothetical protein
MDQARLTGHLSGAFTGLLDVHRMLGELYRLRSRGAFPGSPRGVLVDSSEGVFGITSLDSVDLSSFSESTCRFMSMCTSGTVIVCGKSCESGTVIPIFESRCSAGD